MTLREELIQYCNDIVTGKLKNKSCKRHKQSCMRFLRDLENEDTDKFPYIFNEDTAERFLNWMRLFKHTKGKLAGQYIEPDIIQIFVGSNLYGWLHRDTGLRRFRKAYWQVGRKNAKSQFQACVSSYEAFAFGEDMAEVYIGATKTEQSRIVWNEIKAQLNKCTDLQGRYKIAYGKIEHPKSGSFIAALSKDAGKTGDGLNIHAATVDEYHAHPTSEIYDVLVSGMGARSQPLIVIITTAGFELNHPCYCVEYKYVCQILDPNNPIENDEYFVMINELDKDDEGNLIDDITDPDCWIKANPILCSYEEGIKYIAGEMKAALDVPEKMRNFLTKNMNVWINQRANGYMNMDKWQACRADIPNLTGMECIVGVDLSTKIDLTSIGFEFIMPDGKYVVLSHSFMPEDTVQVKSKTDKVPYDLWVTQGYITATPGSVIDYRFVEQYIYDLVAEQGWTIKEICFDPYNASQIAQNLQSEGYECIEIRQGVKTLSEPTKSFRDLVYDKKIIHDGNPVLAWAISNAVTRQDHNENIMLDKDKSSQRIDPIASLINAHVRAIVMAEEDVMAYDNYDVREL